MRILITGPSKSGKTTLSKHSDYANYHIRHTDDLNGKMEWSQESETVASWFDAPGDWLIEGVTVPRALRKWLKSNAGKPCDQIIWLPKSFLPLDKGQANQAAGMITVWQEILPVLRKRNVSILVK